MTTNTLVFYVILSRVHLLGISLFFNVFLNQNYELQWRPFTQIYSTGVARVPTVASGAFYYRLDVCNLCKLLFQTQFLSKLSNNNYFLFV